MKKILFTKKFLLGLSIFTAANVFAASAATGNNLNNVGAGNLSRFGIISDTVIAPNAESTNFLSILNGNGNGATPATTTNPSGTSMGTNGVALSQELRLTNTDMAALQANGNATKFKVVTSASILTTGDLNYNDVSSNAITVNDLVNGTASHAVYNLSYDKSFAANDIYFQYVIDENGNIYNTYNTNGDVATYRVIKSDNITPNKVLDSIGAKPGVNTAPGTTATTGTNIYNPSNGYVLGSDIAYYAAIGQVQPQVISDINDPRYNTDVANYPVSGGTVHKYLQGDYYNYLVGKFAAKDASNLDPNDVKAWQLKLGVGPALYDGVIGPQGTPKAEDRAVTGRTVYEYVQPQITNINNRIDNLENEIEEAKAGTAMAVAIANIPDNFKEGDLNMFGVGVGYYAGHSAAALGYQRRFSDNAMVIKATAGFNTRGQFSVGAGSSLSW